MSCNWISGLIEWVGIAALGWAAVYAAQVVWVRVVAPRTSWRRFAGEWAVVTGASGGCGAAVADALARRGLHVVLVARSADALARHAAALAAQHHVQTRAIAADVTAPGVWDMLRDQLAALERDTGCPVSVLVNNVGGEPAMCYWTETTLEGETRTWQTNVIPMLRMTRMLLPGMVQRRRGRILNVSSLSSLQAGTLVANYSSDKAKINQFSQALGVELAQQRTGVEVQSHVLGLVCTVGVGFVPADGLHCVEATVIADAMLNIFGRGGYVVVPHWFQALEAWVVAVLPQRFALFAFYLGSLLEQRRINAARAKLKAQQHKAQ